MDKFLDVIVGTIKQVADGLSSRIDAIEQRAAGLGNLEARIQQLEERLAFANGRIQTLEALTIERVAGKASR